MRFYIYLYIFRYFKFADVSVVWGSYPVPGGDMLGFGGDEIKMREIEEMRVGCKYYRIVVRKEAMDGGNKFEYKYRKYKWKYLGLRAGC